MTETRLPPQAMSLRARVEQLPRYYECSYDGMKPAPSGEWVKLADVLALLPPRDGGDGTPVPTHALVVAALPALPRTQQPFG
jgi:hypothetical protein